MPSLVAKINRSQRGNLSGNFKMVEQYLDYAPPVDVYGSLRLLLRHVPEQYLSGLYKITLTNSDSLRSSYRGKFWSEKRRLRPADCSGLYHKGDILLAMDLILQGCPEVFLLFQPIKTFLIGDVFYHEMGHHIHRIEEPGYRADKEAVAEEWKEKLMRAFLRRRYWYLASLARLLSPLIRPVMRRWKKRAVVESPVGPA
jgi:hypothetical protein